MIVSVASRLRLRPLSQIQRCFIIPALSKDVACRSFSAYSATRVAKRPYDFNSGFSSSYDPTQDSGRGPMFTRPSFGVPQFYPRDLKARVDEYVVGQDRAKKTICSTIFNHYQSLRRRTYNQEAEVRAQEKSSRQKWARERDRHHDTIREPHAVEGEHL